MKKDLNFLKHSVILLLVIFHVFGCAKDDHKLIESPLTVGLQKNEVPKESFDIKEEIVHNIIGCFDENSDIIGAPKFSEEYGVITNKKAMYTSNQQIDIYVFPLKMNGEIENLLLVTNENEIFILEKTSSLAWEDVAGTNISPYIARIFDIEAYFSSTLEYSDVVNELQLNFEIGEEDNILILEEISSITGNISSALTGNLNPFCEAAINWMLPLYANFLNLSLVEPFDYTDELYNAIVECHPSGEFCVCPGLNCVLENLIPNVTDVETKADLMILYIIDKMNLQCVDASSLLLLDFVSIEEMYIGAQNSLLTISDCNQITVPPLYLSSCEDAFPFTEITGTYYTQTNYINHSYWSEFNPFNYVSFCQPNLCIQVPKQNSLGITFSEEEATQMVVHAFDEARLSVYYEVESGDIETSAAGKVAFVDFLINELADAFIVVPSSVSVNQVPCNNGALVADFGVSLFGLCLAPGECFYD